MNLHKLYIKETNQIDDYVEWLEMSLKSSDKTNLKATSLPTTWKRGNGTEIEIAEMSIFHLKGALGKCTTGTPMYNALQKQIDILDGDK